MSTDIVMAMEQHDQILGMWLPNTCSKTWYLKERGEIRLPGALAPYLFKDWYNQEWSIDQVTPRMYGVTYAHYPTITGKYLYPVFVSNPEYFTAHRDIGFKCVDPNILQEIRDGRAEMVFMHQYEGFAGAFGHIAILEQWCEDANIPFERVHYIHGDLRGRARINYHPVSVFEGWVNRDSALGPAGYTPDNQSLFLCYNNRPHPHRALLYAALVDRGLNHRGRVSYNPMWNSPNETMFREYDPNLLERSRSVIATGQSIGEPSVIHDAGKITVEDYRNTFCSVVTETLVNPDVLFISEKTWKPIVMGHPFMILGSPGTLTYLQSRGYKTFHRWFDETYDRELSAAKRTKIIVDELERLSRMSERQLVSMRKEMHAVCEHNRHLYRNDINTKFVGARGGYSLLAPVYHTLCKIWDNLNSR